MRKPAPQAASIPRKRLPRRRRRSVPGPAEADVAAVFADWEPLHQLAATLPHWESGDNGRPPHVPPAAVLLFGAMAWGCGGERKTERAFRHKATWEPIRAALAARYPEYPGLRPETAPMDRSEYRRYRDAYGIQPEFFEQLREAFEEETATLAMELGMFDPAQGTVSHPSPQNMLFGDGTVLRPRFDATPGDCQVNTLTGEIEQKPNDPDAEWFVTGDKRHIRGTKFGFVEACLPYENERLILSVFNVNSRKGMDEASQALCRIERLTDLLPAAQGVVWDMALRGTHINHLYQLGQIPVVKTPKAKGGMDRSKKIGPLPARIAGAIHESLEVMTVNGAPCIKVIAAGEEHWVRLDWVARMRHRQRCRGYRWYNEYIIPDRPPVPTALRGAKVKVRLDQTQEDRRRQLNRPEHLKAVSEGDPDWDRLFGLRPGAESVNRWLKERLRDQRAPAVGAPRQHFSLVCAGIYNNFKALLAQRQRLGLSLSGDPPPVQAPAA